MDSWPPEILTDSLAGLLARSSAALAAALGRLADVAGELQTLVEAGTARPWTNEEFGRYVALAKEERAAHRRYDAARHWYDGVRRRLRQRAAALERERSRRDPRRSS